MSKSDFIDSCVSAHVIGDLKKEIAKVKNEFLNAGDNLKEKCNSARKALQVQIEVYQEKLKTIHEHFLREIDVHEANNVRHFGPGSELEDKMSEFLDQADETFNKIEMNEVIDVQNKLEVLRSESKVMMTNLETKNCENSFIEFKPTDVALISSDIGHINYRGSDFLLKSLQDMNSIDLTKLRSYDSRYHFSWCVRLNADEFLAVFVDKGHKVLCIKFDTLANELKSIDCLGDLTAGIRIYRVCKFGSYLYFYAYVERKKLREGIYDRSPEFHRFFLTQCDLNLNVCRQFEVKKQLLCIVANSKNLYCSQKDRQQISVYDSGAEFNNTVKRVINFKWDDSTVAKPILFHQIEIFESSLLLYTTGRVLILNESTGAVLKVLSLSLNNFKCLENDFLLCNMRHEKKLMIYDVKNEKVCEEKPFNEVLGLVYADECLISVALFILGEPRIYF
jgi:hypothetical protein